MVALGGSGRSFVAGLVADGLAAPGAAADIGAAESGHRRQARDPGALQDVGAVGFHEQVALARADLAVGDLAAVARDAARRRAEGAHHAGDLARPAASAAAAPAAAAVGNADRGTDDE